MSKKGVPLVKRDLTLLDQSGTVVKCTSQPAHATQMSSDRGVLQVTACLILLNCCL